MILEALLRGGLLPALVAGALLFLTGRLLRGEDRAEARRGLQPVAFAAGHAAAQVALVGWPPFPPRESTHGLFYIALAASLLSPLANASGIQASIRWMAAGVLAFGVPLLLLRSRIVQRWSATESLLAVGAIGTALLALGGGARTATRLPGPVSFLVLLIPVGSAAGVLGLSGTALHSQLAGAVAAGLGAGLLLSVTRSCDPISPAAARLVSTLLGSVLITGHFYARVPAINALLLASCPLITASLGSLRRIRNLPRWQATLVQALGPGIPAACALGLSLREFLASDFGGF